MLYLPFVDYWLLTSLFVVSRFALDYGYGDKDGADYGYGDNAGEWKCTRAIHTFDLKVGIWTHPYPSLVYFLKTTAMEIPVVQTTATEILVVPIMG